MHGHVGSLPRRYQTIEFTKWFQIFHFYQSSDTNTRASINTYCQPRQISAKRTNTYCVGRWVCTRGDSRSIKSFLGESSRSVGAIPLTFNRSICEWPRGQFRAHIAPLKACVYLKPRLTVRPIFVVITAAGERRHARWWIKKQRPSPETIRSVGI